MTASTLHPPLARRFAEPERPPPEADRRTEDGYLRRAFRHHSRTFSLATRLLPRRERLPVAVLYLYCRTVDTLADERVLDIGVGRALAEVDALETALEQTLGGRPPRTGPHALLWKRLAEVHRAYELRAEPLRQLLDGARWDLEDRPIDTTDDLLAYAERVAGSVGAAMLPFLVRDRADVDRLDGPARALGNAMQITNVLRDVGEDWRDLRRCYLPARLVDEAGLSLDALLGAAPEVPDRYADLLEGLMTRAEALYTEADGGIDRLRPAAQTGIRAAGRMYREILNGVRANGYDNLTRRAVVPLHRKVRLVVSDDYGRRRDGLRRAR